MTLSADHLRTTPPPRPHDAVAWGVRDAATNTIPVYTESGLWFTFDCETGREIVKTAPPISEAEIIAEMHANADEVETVSLCYFIGAEDGPIKIGHSVDVPARLKAFQMGCPVKLSILATASGGCDRELAYHYQFQSRRAHGEWFERCPEILAEIERLRKGCEPK